MSHGFDQIQDAASAVRHRFEMLADATKPLVGLVLGSGLGDFADHILPIKKLKSLPYVDIPHFPPSTIVGHKGQLHYGLLNGTRVLAMQGRVHRYEGYSATQVVFPIRVMAALGIKTLVLTNAAGAINKDFNVGDLMLINDHLNMTGDNPLLGPNDAKLGTRFLDMSEAYAKPARTIAHAVAAKENIVLRDGTYCSILGPSYETPAEIRMMRSWGADAVGMSTALETIAARHGGVEVVGISCLTNMAAGITGNALDHAEVTQIANLAGDKFTKLLFALIPELAKS